MFCEKEALNLLTLADEIWQLSEASYFYGSPWSSEQFETDLYQESSHYLFLVEANQLVGFVSYYSVLDEVDITHVVINKEFQQQGQGRRLLRELVERLKQQQILNLFLEVRVSNSAAISLYQEIGFEKINLRKNYYQHPREDAVMMCYKIRK